MVPLHLTHTECCMRSQQSYSAIILNPIPGKKGRGKKKAQDCTVGACSCNKIQEKVILPEFIA